MESNLELAPTPELRQALQSFGPEVLGSVPASALATRINLYFSRACSQNTRVSFEEIFGREEIAVLQKLGITAEFMEEAARTSLAPPPYKMRSEVARAVETSLRKLCTAVQPLADRYSESFSSDAGTLERPDFGTITWNAWLCACLLYGAWKVRSFVPGIFRSQPDQEQLTAAIESCREWLFSEDVILRGTDATGWGSKTPADKTDPMRPMLHDTAFVTNILVKVAPEHEDGVYEECLETIFDMRDEGTGLWRDESRREVDIAGTAHALRFLSNYLKHRPEEKFRRDREELERTRDYIYYALCDRQEKDGHWASYEEMTNTLGGLSSRAVTALVLQALRDADVPRGVKPVTDGCDWLLRELECVDGTWCWTIRTEQGNLPSVYESSWIVSALLKSSTYSKFAKAELVVDWLRKESDRPELRRENVVHFGTAVCALADYLRAWTISGFFKY